MPDPEGSGFLSQLHRNLSSGLEVIDKIPTYFETIIDKNLWQRQDLPNGMVIIAKSFRNFIENPPPKGFGISIGKLKEICRLHPRVLAKIDALTGEGSEGYGQASSPDQRRIRRRLERLLKDFPKDQVVQELRKMGIF